jgi:hypothetical protein
MVQTQRDPDAMMPSLQAKLEQFADALTPEEWEHLRLLVQRAGAGAAGGEPADVTGYRKAEYEDTDGYKGRPGTNPAFQPQGGGGDLWALVPQPYERAWNVVKNLRPGDFIPL